MHQPAGRARPGIPDTPHTSTTPSIPQHRVQGDKKDGIKVNIKRRESTQASRFCLLLFLLNPPDILQSHPSSSLFASGWLPAVPGHSGVFGSASRPTGATQSRAQSWFAVLPFRSTNQLACPAWSRTRPAGIHPHLNGLAPITKHHHMLTSARSRSCHRASPSGAHPSAELQPPFPGFLIAQTRWLKLRQPTRREIVLSPPSPARPAPILLTTATTCPPGSAVAHLWPAGPGAGRSRRSILHQALRPPTRRRPTCRATLP